MEAVDPAGRSASHRRSVCLVFRMVSDHEDPHTSRDDGHHRRRDRLETRALRPRARRPQRMRAPSGHSARHQARTSSVPTRKTNRPNLRSPGCRPSLARRSSRSNGATPRKASWLPVASAWIPPGGRICRAAGPVSSPRAPAGHRSRVRTAESPASRSPHWRRLEAAPRQSALREDHVTDPDEPEFRLRDSSQRRSTERCRPDRPSRVAVMPSAAVGRTGVKENSFVWSVPADLDRVALGDFLLQQGGGQGVGQPLLDDPLERPGAVGRVEALLRPAAPWPRR